MKFMKRKMNSQDYTQWGLPEGAKAYLGKGNR